MRVRSLRAQLALWHAGLLAVTLVALAGLTYLVLLRVLHSRADAALERYAETTSKQIAAQLFQSRAIRARRFPGSSWKGPSVLGPRSSRSWIASGRSSMRRTRCEVRSCPAKSDGPPPRAARRSDLRDGQQAGRTPPADRHDARPDGRGSPVSWSRRHLPGRRGGGAPARRYDPADPDSLRLLAVAPGGGSLVGRALPPVDELTRTAMEIEHRHLDRRVESPRPDDEIGRLAGAFNEMLVPAAPQLPADPAVQRRCLARAEDPPHHYPRRSGSGAHGRSSRLRSIARRCRASSRKRNGWAPSWTTSSRSRGRMPTRYGEARARCAA